MLSSSRRSVYDLSEQPAAGASFWRDGTPIFRSEAAADPRSSPAPRARRAAPRLACTGFAPPVLKCRAGRGAQHATADESGTAAAAYEWHRLRLLAAPTGAPPARRLARLCVLASVRERSRVTRTRRAWQLGASGFSVVAYANSNDGTGGPEDYMAQAAAVAHKHNVVRFWVPPL
jgi:hypothetical protein